jgi:hypothetical protein
MKAKTLPNPKQDDALRRWDSEGGAPPSGDRSHQRPGKSQKADKSVREKGQAR